jgi:ParB-like chromosome segregation protein Spo0J
MSKMTVVLRECDELRPHPDNPRNGDIDSIAESLTLNGQFKPIVTTTNGVILAGNHTYHAALQIGWKHIQCVVLDLDPYSNEAKRIMLADNRTSDRARYDDGILIDLLESLEDSDRALQGTGFDESDLEYLKKNHDIIIDEKPDFDEFDTDLPVDYRCPSCAYEWSGLPKPEVGSVLR